MCFWIQYTSEGKFTQSHFLHIFFLKGIELMKTSPLLKETSVNTPSSLIYSMALSRDIQKCTSRVVRIQSAVWFIQWHSPDTLNNAFLEWCEYTQQSDLFNGTLQIHSRMYLKSGANTLSSLICLSLCFVYMFSCKTCVVKLMLEIL